nr:hypothetical protein [uncultured bacterium]
MADGAMNAASNSPNKSILTSATAAFTLADVGKRIVVAGAGAAGADLDTFIAQRISPTQVALKAPAQTTVSGANVSYAKGVYRLSTVLRGADVDGHIYQLSALRRLQIQIAANSPAGTLYIGGPYVTPTNRGSELTGAGDIENYSPGGRPMATISDDYVTATVDNFLINVMWADDLNQST